jgi:condensin complex subunit 2
LTIKKFDLEFAIDPLFKKTIAEFDQLSVNTDGKIIFNASDAKLDNNRMTTETIEEDNTTPKFSLVYLFFLIIGV